MHRLVYASSAARPFSADDLRLLLEQSRIHNENAGLTGMLLYKDGNFLQVLEGDEAELAPLYERIKRDSRHHGIITLIHEPAVERDFPQWSMDFENLDQLKLPHGYSEFLHWRFDDSEFHARPSLSLDLLRRFRRTLG